MHTLNKILNSLGANFQVITRSLVLIGAASVSTVHAQSWNARDEYSLTQGGTTGVWSYGYSTSDTDHTFTQYVLNDTPPSCSGGFYERWYDNSNLDYTPQVLRNPGLNTCDNIAPEMLFVHPGPSGKRSVIRWTAPVAGTFRIKGVLQKQNYSATTQLMILKNATLPAIATGTIGANYQYAYDELVTVAINDTLDFSVGFSNGGYNSDGSVISIRIDPPTNECQPAPADLRIWLPGENSTTDIQSPNYNTSLVGNATYATGKIGNAFSFDGLGSYVKIEDNLAQRPASALTIEGWFKFNSVGGLVSLVSKPLRNTALNSYSMYLDSGTLRGIVGNASSYTRVNSSFSPPLNVWQHLAFTYSMSGGVSTLKIYANGVDVSGGVDGTANLPITYDADPYPLLIGGEYENNAQGFYLDGMADEVSLYERALSRQEIEQLSRQQSVGKCPPVSLPSQQTPLNPSASQVAWFAGDGDTRDLTNTHPNAIAHGNTNYRVGRVSQAFNFDGNGDYLEIPDLESHRPTTQLTIEGWFKFNSLGAASLISKSFTNSVYNSYVLFIENNRIQGGYGSDGTFIRNDPGITPRIGEWYHLAYTINPAGNTHTLYINGKPYVGASTQPLVYEATPQPLIIGAEVEVISNPSRFLNGLADEIGIHSNALSATDVLAIYEKGQTGRAKQQSAAIGTNVSTTLSDATVTLASVTAAGTHSENGIDLALLPPLPANMKFTGLAYELATGATYQSGRRNDAQVSFNIPALSNFPLLRVLHLEEGAWVNRTDRTSAGTLLKTNNLRSLSPFVIVEAEAAFTGMVDQVTAEDTSTSLNLEVTDPGTITSITATSSNPTLVPNIPANLSVSGSGTTRTVNIIPAADQHGDAIISVTITRGSTSLTDSITLTVLEVNDAPIVTTDTLSSVAEDSGQRTILFSELIANDQTGPSNESAQTITVHEVGNAVGGSVSIDGTNVLFTPDLDFFGDASFTYTILDNGNTDGVSDPKTSTEATVNFTVTPVNDSPIATDEILDAIDEDATAFSIPISSLLVNDSSGPDNESSQTLQITSVSNAVGGSVSLSGNDVIFTPGLHFNGMASFDYLITDNGVTNDQDDFLSDTGSASFTVNAVNDAPSFTKGADPVVLEDAGAQTVPNWASAISAGPADESGQVLTFAVSNDNNSLFSSQPTVNSSGTLSFTPAVDQNGTATVTISLSDNGGTALGGVDSSAAQTFTITVTPVNDVPSFIKGANQVVLEDASAQSIANWATSISAGPANESSQAIVFTATNNNNPLFSIQPAISASGTLTYTLAPNQNGFATITVSIADDGGTLNGGVNTSASQTFTITVNAVNDAPSFTKGVDQIVNEDAGIQSISSWATAISSGPADESAQTLSFTVTNDNNALFSVQPTISSNGILSYTPAPNMHGTSTVTVNLTDSGGVSNGGVATSSNQTFTITVNSVNDAPSFTKGADFTLLRNAGAQTIANWATNLSPGPANEGGQVLSFVVSANTNSGLFATPPAISSSGTLTFTPATNTSGSATITFALSDNGGTSNEGVDTSASQTFIITIDSAVETWRKVKFGASYNDANVSGLTADPNQNGIPNLLEYALGLEPLAASVSTVKWGTIVISNVEYQTFSYTQPTGLNTASDVTYSPQRTTSLNTEFSTNDIVPVDVTPGPGSLETVRVRSVVPIQGQSKEFFQLKVTLNP